MGELETVLDPDEHGRGVELSTINPAYVGKEYRYLYACSARRPCNFFNALTKMDLVQKEAKSWHEEGTVPSEPFFVARPGATSEDDGLFNTSSIPKSMFLMMHGVELILFLTVKTSTNSCRRCHIYCKHHGW